jgi:methylated-DNA-protein-cysteine methyltransferase-like protein
MTDFSTRVVQIALSIPPGKVSTYGDIARAAGGGGQSARSITAILGKAYKAGEKGIPFHRIVYSGGKVWTGSAYDAKRKKLYKEEGIRVDSKGRIENFRDILISFR